MSRPLIVLGGAGDLMARLLLPSLVHLAGESDSAPAVVAVATDDMDEDGYRRWVTEQLGHHGDAEDAGLHQSIADDGTYVRGDVTDPQTLRTAIRRAQALDAGAPAIYLALPNTIFADTLTALVEAGVPEGTVIAVEKPFGSDKDDAHRLNELLHRMVPESQVFRVDHVMAKRTVLNILGLRFANRLFEPLWNTQHIDRIEIRYDETLALEGRAHYYDSAGALRDMLQNHLLQILALVLMEPPHTIDSAALGAAKTEALRSVRTLTRQDAVRGRYRRGRVGDAEVPSYAEEDGVDPGRGTETFTECVVHVDNWRWAGVPILLRTGKALSRSRKQVCVHFRRVPHSPFTGPPPEPNVLRLDLETDAMELDLDINGEGDPFDLERRTFATEPAPAPVPAYATVLSGLLQGDTTLSISDQEAEQSWRIVEGVLAAWADSLDDLVEYDAGSDGPGPT